jgi:hypothetical protein
MEWKKKIKLFFLMALEFEDRASHLQTGTLPLEPLGQPENKTFMTFGILKQLTALVLIYF